MKKNNLLSKKEIAEVKAMIRASRRDARKKSVIAAGIELSRSIQSFTAEDLSKKMDFII